MKLCPLFILADLEAGGAQRVILTILRYLDQRHFAPQLCLVNSSGPLFKEIPENVKIHNLKISRLRYAIPKILTLIRSLRPQAVMSTLGHLNLSILGLRYLLPDGTRLIVREANTPSIRLRYTRSPKLYRLLYRMFYPFADMVVCNSQYMKRDLINFINLSPKKVCIIPNPVDTERIQRALRSGVSPYKPGHTHLVSVGRLHYQKGFDLLLKVFKKSLLHSKGFHLSIVGEGPERKALEKLANELEIMNFVNFVGHQNNPFLFMAHADLFISSSRWEGLPNAVLESLACGTPVLAFDCPGGTKEIIVHARNGWLVPSENIEAMSEKLLQLAQKKAWLKWVDTDLLPEKYTCENVIKRYEKILLER